MSSSVLFSSAGIEPEQIRAALDALLASESFRRSRRARELLTYLVEESLAGRADALKAYAIAVDVFGRGPSFDAENDTLVRVQAGRLRTLLETYYAGEGRHEALRIALPRGGYALTFQRASAAGRGAREETSAGSPRRRGGWLLPLLAGLVGVLGYALYDALREGPAPEPRPGLIRLLVAGDGQDASERVLLRIARDVAARFSGFQTVIREEGGRQYLWPEDYRLRVEREGGSGSGVVFLTALHAQSGTVIGSVRLAQPGDDPLANTLPVERALVRLLQPVGAVVSDYQRRGNYSPVMACLLMLEDYLAEPDDARHAAARACAENRIEAGFRDAHLHGALAVLHMDEVTERRNPRPGDALKRALAAAQRAAEIAPGDSAVHERLMAIFSLTGDLDQMEREGRQALALNPSNAALLAGFAAQLNLRGQFAEALALLQRAEVLQPLAPRWRAYAFFLALYGLNRMDEAAERAATLVGTSQPLFLAARVIVARYRHDAVERNEAFIALAQQERGFLKNPRAVFERRHYTPALIDRLVADLLDPGP